MHTTVLKLPQRGAILISAMQPVLIFSNMARLRQGYVFQVSSITITKTDSNENNNFSLYSKGFKRCFLFKPQSSSENLMSNEPLRASLLTVDLGVYNEIMHMISSMTLTMTAR